MRWARCVAIKNNVPFVHSIQFAIKYAITERAISLYLIALHFGVTNVDKFICGVAVFHSIHRVRSLILLLLYSSSSRMIVDRNAKQ